jgi:hypothetical protein
MIALRITLAAQLCGLGMGAATIAGLVPPTVRLIRMLN